MIVNRLHTVMNNILNNEEDLMEYCETLTGHLPDDEDDAQDTILEYLISNDDELDRLFIQLNKTPIKLSLVAAVAIYG